jgi:hypothetical protein
MTAAQQLAQQCEAILTTLQCELITRVQVSDGVLDLAFRTPSGEQVLIRCGPDLPVEDVEALSLIAAQGTFDRVALVGAASAAIASDIPLWSLAEFARHAPAVVLARPSSAQ